ncbi:alpha-2-macroglobulin-like [Toxotes jaculatrix]|uniref:alpha-2-macroglobulin-like n=1 Tax=Toxotes jaculatrix TaxID=941984 RepID=UPI001B3A942B|nr:alpha-2-macroglobulin-like [Toxotes jaculatrix]
MALSVAQIRTWKLFACLSCLCVGQVLANPQYMVAIPAVLEAGAETKFCASLMQPNENLLMTVTLISQEGNTTLFQKASSEAFHTCVAFQVPIVQHEEVQRFQVEVQGDTFYSKDVRKVKIQFHPLMTFIQTDKPIYLPGQTVHFRVITLDSRLRPASRLYNFIEIKDAFNNRIGQWLNKSSDGKILQLSYSLNSEVRTGIYQISVATDRQIMTYNFKVERYVLPKFELKISAPDELNVGQEEFKTEVCLKYTYGQAVPGSVEVKVCQPLEHNHYGFYHHSRVHQLKAPCSNERKQADKKGCATFTFKMSTFTKLDQWVLKDELDFSAKGEEEGTGISVSHAKRLLLSYQAGTLSFIDTPTIYDQGSNVKAKVKAVHYNNTPIPDMVVYVSTGELWFTHPLQNLTTGSDGIAAFSLNTSNFNGRIHLHVSSTPIPQRHVHKTPFYKAGDHTLYMAQLSSPHTVSVSSMNVKSKDKQLSCDGEEEISIQYTVVGETQGSVNVIYLVLSRGAIVMQGLKTIEVQDKSVSAGEVSIMLKMSPEMTPDIQVVAYAVLPSENVISSSADFHTEKCFSHKVSLEFSPSSAVPGEQTTMQVTAQPGSLCGISAVDQSVLIMEPGKKMNTDKIFEKLPVRKASHIPYEARDPVECLHVRPRRFIYPSRIVAGDAHITFQLVGLKMATNLIILTPTCLRFEGREYRITENHVVHHYGQSGRQGETGRVETRHDMVLYGDLVEVYPFVPPIETVRSFFPETWIWNLVEVGESGTKDVSLTVPDTITTWETEAFCLSPQGFGLAPRQNITVFQPFFLELTLPYSIIRGEHFELKATVFNYLTKCIMVSVTPAPSLDYTLTPLSGDQYTSCLCGNEHKTLSWTMAPSALGVVNVSVTAEAMASNILCDNEIVSVPDRGRVDVVTRSLIVKAEGTEMTKTYNWLLCPKGEALTEEIDIQLPENVIDGSARASLSVLGDILGRALKNLHRLLRIPCGNGEQNMALLASNIYILQYLKNTQQLTPAILEKATKLMTSGYQRQLNYKHENDAYSTFGSGIGNSWLTAFVVRSFAKAQSFIYINPKNIEKSKTWLQSKQQENGCFQQFGKLFNNRMQGGVSDEVTLTAYITAAFLEMNNSVDDPAVKKSLSCLKESISDLSNTYTTALLAYVFTLAGDSETRAHLLQHLDTVALKQGGFLQWSQTATETSASLSVEISSYVLLARLSASPTTEDLGYTTRIVRWLTSQQNYYGGFCSTQDTVVALQALALYSTLVFSPDGSSTVTVQSPSGQLTFDVNQDNKLLYQEKTLQDTSGKYSLEVKGTACASVQIALHYNIPTPIDDTTISVKVRSETNCTTKSQRPKLTLSFTSLYRGKGIITNLVILEIKMLSGFVPDQESLKQLRGSFLVSQVEQKEDQVLVYIWQLPQGRAIDHRLVLKQKLPVQNLKPAVVQIYDYYQPSDQAKTEYIYPCAAA